MSNPTKTEPSLRPESLDSDHEFENVSLFSHDEAVPGAPDVPDPPDQQDGAPESARTDGHGDGQCWVVVGDIHGDLENLAAIPELPGAVGVIVVGDLTKLGGVSSARDVIEAIQAINPVVLAQIGNADRPEVDGWLEAQGINLHCKARELTPDVVILGVGGSVFTPFGTPSEFPEARFAEWLERLAQLASGHKHVIVASHNPPYDTLCDSLGGGGHAGSRALREFIEEHQPDLCLCGHIHEAYGQQLLGRTLVLNPGALAGGGYIVLRLGGQVSARLCKIGSPRK